MSPGAWQKAPGLVAACRKDERVFTELYSGRGYQKLLNSGTQVS